MVWRLTRVVLPVLSVVGRHTVAFWRAATALVCSNLIEAILAADLVRRVVQRSQLGVGTLAAWPHRACALGVVVEVTLLLLASLLLLLRRLNVVNLLELWLSEVLHP